MTKTDKFNLLVSSQNPSLDNHTWKVNVVIPFFNAQDAVDHISRELMESPNYLEFTWWLVDNGSSQRLEFPRDLPAQVVTIRLPDNLNFGGVVKFIETRIHEESYIGWLPGNGKIAIVDAHEWFKAALQSLQKISKATRLRAEVVQNIKTYVASTFLSIVTNIPIEDPGGTPTLIHPNLRKSFFKFAPEGIEIEVYTLGWAHRQGVNIFRGPIVYRERVAGKSSWRRGLKSEIQMLAKFLSILRKLD